MEVLTKLKKMSKIKYSGCFPLSIIAVSDFFLCIKPGVANSAFSLSRHSLSE